MPLAYSKKGEKTIGNELLISRSLDYKGRADRQRKQRLIRIDAREPRDGITDVLLGGMGYSTERAILPLGDYQWESKLGLCVIERKTPADAHDMDRLRQQVQRLRGASGVLPILLIDWRSRYENPWKDHDFDNLLVSIQGTIRVAHCLQGQLAHRLDSLYKWSQRTGHTFFEEQSMGLLEPEQASPKAKPRGAGFGVV